LRSLLQQNVSENKSLAEPSPVSTAPSTVMEPTFASSPYASPKKRPSSMTIEGENQRIQTKVLVAEVDEPRTPPQPTVPSDPNFSGGSNESSTEDHTTTMIYEFIRTALGLFERSLSRITWPKHGGDYRLDVSK
jgi:hypothetical protein